MSSITIKRPSRELQNFWEALNALSDYAERIRSAGDSDDPSDEAIAYLLKDTVERMNKSFSDDGLGGERWTAVDVAQYGRTFEPFLAAGRMLWQEEEVGDPINHQGGFYSLRSLIRVMSKTLEEHLSAVGQQVTGEGPKGGVPPS